MIKAKYFDKKNKCLKDKKIIKKLKQCIEDYESGEILEVAIELNEIVNAIYKFSDWLEEEETE